MFLSVVVQGYFNIFTLGPEIQSQCVPGTQPTPRISEPSGHYRQTTVQKKRSYIEACLQRVGVGVGVVTRSWMSKARALN